MQSILVVDDDPAILSGITTLVQQHGYSVWSASSGALACQILETDGAPNLVILDIMMPEMDGYRVCQYIRAQPRYIPILMLSAKDDIADKVYGLELGADDYLTKPFSPPELVARIRAVLRLADQQRQDRQILTYYELSLTLETCEARVNQVLLDLSSKEWQVLRILMEQPGRVFGREALLALVWQSRASARASAR